MYHHLKIVINKICQALKTCLYFILKINRKNNAISLYQNKNSWIKYNLKLTIDKA